jgi:superfamily I DNA/RNA helicase
MKLLFKTWLVESYLREMATLNFGGDKGHRGKDHTNVPDHYLKWMQDQIKQGKGNFDVSDQGRRLNPQQLSGLIDQEFARRSGGNRQQQPQMPQGQQQTQQPAQSTTGAWIYAKSIAAKPEYQMPAPNLDLAMKQSNSGEWLFVILDPSEGRLVSRGSIPTPDLRNVVQSQKDNNGQLVRGNKPSEILEKITPKKEKKGGNEIPEDRITEEQKAIEDKFARMLSSPTQDHMMISALAGSGKTTVLKHLAWKFGKGKKWLYLVFNSKNKEEAKEEFPPSVVVDTTNAWAGREVLGKNLLKPTDRIQQFSRSEKAKMVADSPGFHQLTKSMRIPDQNEEYGPDPKRLGGTQKTLWYTLRSINIEFKSEAVKLLGLAKSFAVDPRNEQQLEQGLKSVMSKYDLNTSLEDIKERVQKNSPWAVQYISDLMGTNFIERDFTEELMKATIWLMHQVMPHASQEKFIADAGDQAGTEQMLGTKRDFDDDLWFSAIHANELKWPKYEVVLADEVQDFNVAQQIILKKLAENGAKIVAVGDKNQSIYRFRGADSNAFGQLSDMLTNISHDKDVTQNLTQNFRSRQAVIDFSNEEGQEAGHVSNLVKGRNFSEEPGHIGKGQATKYEVNYEQAFDTLKKEMNDMGEIKQTAFLSRTNEPLVHASLNLMKANIPFVILGKDIANDLNKHIDKMISLFRLSNDSSIDELQAGLGEYSQDQDEKHAGKAAMQGKLKEIKEITEAMQSALQQFQEEVQNGSVFQFRKWMRSKFGGIDIDKGGREGEMARAEYKKKLKELNPVILSTVHKSKGLQFQRVFILRDDLWPHPRASRQADLDQEMNNKYIGRTRAEDELHVLDLKGQPGYKDSENSEE